MTQTTEVRPTTVIGTRPIRHDGLDKVTGRAIDVLASRVEGLHRVKVDTVVVGAGVVGLLTAWLCSRLAGADVRVFDIDPRRATPAQAAQA